jgi:2-phospho-L-lactate transferase/gluconeogenesis factor (CofD/UPF0052 family)/hydroxymethylpyrimidine pyrophosphatase-like HAD family hydrolase
MTNILIFSGGTGSIALQRGLYQDYGDLINIQILTNAYDNGKSTGEVRKVFNGKILGPSDVRKNQLTQYELRRNNFNFKQELVDFLEHRFTCETKDAEQYCISTTLQKVGSVLKQHDLDILLNSIHFFFSQQKSKIIDYTNFSLSNIIYASLAAKYGFSLTAAAEIMAEILELPKDLIILNDDNSLFLRAVTEHQHHILDEGEIVEWNNFEDKIKDIYFVDNKSNADWPILNDKSINAIKNADIIIFSAGTQWASLIPTYVSRVENTTFKQLIKQSKAKKFLVVNNVPDKDMSGRDINYISSILDNYLPLEDITFVFNTEAHPSLSLSKFENSSKYDCIESKLSLKASSCHNEKLSNAIMSKYYEHYLKNDVFIFDFDDTLVGRNNEFKDASSLNLMLLLSLQQFNKKAYIFTGNYVKSLNLNTINYFFKSKYSSLYDPSRVNNIDFLFLYTVLSDQLEVFADGGVNYYKLKVVCDSKNEVKFIIPLPECIDESASFSDKEITNILNNLAEAEINPTKIQNRNNAMISIKPIDNEYRNSLVMLLNILMKFKYNVRSSGRTTIDISHHLNSKELSLNYLKNMLKQDNKNMTYIGDESHFGGNDYIISKNKNIDYLHVNNPQDTAVMLLTLFNQDNGELNV